MTPKDKFCVFATFGMSGVLIILTLLDTLPLFMCVLLNLVMFISVFFVIKRVPE